MGLTLTVGRPKDVFQRSYARSVVSELQRIAPGSLTYPLFMQPWHSEELAWSGWALLQSSVSEALGNPEQSHIKAVDAWCGVFLPLELTPLVVEVPGSATPLQVASAWSLERELRAFAERRGLPTVESDLRALFDRYLANNDQADSDLDIQVYSQLMQAVGVARRRRQPLWIVK